MISIIVAIAENGVIGDKNALLWNIKEDMRRFFSQQFKRSAAPDGPKVVTVSLSPRGDWRMPSDANGNEWFK